jgi:hypothetical protein
MRIVDVLNNPEKEILKERKLGKIKNIGIW